MLTLVRRVSAAVAILTLCVGNLAVCAGWQSTPEARMACCRDGAICPMHEADGAGRSSTPAVTQAQADSCCAAATEQHHAATGDSGWAVAGMTPLTAIAAFSIPTISSAQRHWRAPLDPVPIASIPKHLLLSVLLV